MDTLPKSILGGAEFFKGTDDIIPTRKKGWLMLWLCIAVHLLPAQYIAVGNYVGNGTSNRNIIDVGFQPDVILIKGNTNTDPVIKTNTMSGTLSRRMTVNAAAESNRITALLSNGFRVSNINTVNASGIDYYWVAFQNVAGKVATGSYTGNGSDNRNITGVGFSPDYLILVPQSDQQSLMRFSSNPSGDVSFFFNNTVRQSNAIQALHSDGFQVGTSPSANANGTIYHWVAFKADGENIIVDKYVGDGDDNRFVSTPIDPIFLIIKSYENRWPYQKIATLCGDAAFNFTNQDEYINNIQAFGDGGFEVGDDNSVNQLGVEHYYFTVAGAITGTDCSLLPIELVSFDGKQNLDVVDLQWRTASETNNDHFEIYRSANGTNWTFLGTVLGHGSTTESNNYYWTDDNPVYPINYYKLKQVDFSGEHTYSDIIEVKLKNHHDEVSLYPNPSNDFINFNNTEFPLTVSVYNTSGTKYMERNITSINDQLNLVGLPKGMYVINVKNAGYTQQFKILKN